MGMNRNQFTLALVEHSTKGLTVSQAEEMVKQFDSYRRSPTGDYYENLISDVLEWADHFATATHEDKDQVFAIWEADDPDVVVVSLDLEIRLRPTVEAVRVRLFGSPEPRWSPAQYDDAVAWIRETEQRASKRITKKQDNRLAELRKQHHEIAREFGEIRGITPPGFAERSEHLEFVESAGTLGVARARADSDLGYLAERVKRIADFTGLSRSDVLAHILTGSELIRHPVTLETKKKVFWHDGVAATEKVASVTFRGPNVTSKQMEQIRQWVKGQWNDYGRKAYTGKDRDLYRVMMSRGGPPKCEWKRFWSEIATELGYKDHYVPYKRWVRLQCKLDSRRIVGEDPLASDQT